MAIQNCDLQPDDGMLPWRGEFNAAAATRRLIEALHDTMAEIRRHHPDVPETVTLIAPVQRSVLAYHRRETWQFGGELLSEVCINADYLSLGPEVVLLSLLHEAVHAAQHTLGIKGTSRQGPFHNRRFRDGAVEFGLIVDRDPVIGHVTVGLAPVAYERYGRNLVDLDRDLVLVRQPYSRLVTLPDPSGESSADAVETASEHAGYVGASCGCRTAHGRPRRLRMAVGSWEVGPVECTVCRQPFRRGSGLTVSVNGGPGRSDRSERKGGPP